MTAKNARAARASAPAGAVSRQRIDDRRRKADAVADKLGLDIASRKILPGQRLPTEAELGRAHGVSRPSLREALRMLAQKGLVESRTRRGTTVRDRDRWDCLDYDVLRWMAAGPVDAKLMDDLLEVRRIFEPAAARLAAQRARPDQILAIEREFDGMRSALPGDLEAGHRHDLAFHDAIVAATGNALLIRFAAAIRTALMASFRATEEACASYERSLRQHGAVAAAISRRAPREAERAMRDLLADTAQDLAPMLERPLPAKDTTRAKRANGLSTSRKSNQDRTRRKHHEQTLSDH